MEITKVKQVLRASANQSLKKGYKGDYADYMFRVYVLDLLAKLVTKKPIKVEPLMRRIEKLERELDFYIKEYPEQLEKLENDKNMHS